MTSSSAATTVRLPRDVLSVRLRAFADVACGHRLGTSPGAAIQQAVLDVLLKIDGADAAPTDWTAADDSPR